MGFLVVAQPPAEFAAWLEAQQAPGATPADEQAAGGREVFMSSGCAECHVIRGVTANTAARPGPDLTHLSSRQAIASDTIENTPENLARWLRDPGAVKPGTTMPTPELSPEQIDRLVAYLEQLG